MGDETINYTTMSTTTKIFSKSEKIWLVSVYNELKSEFVIKGISLGPLRTERTLPFSQAHLKQNWRDFATYRVREVT